MARYAERECPVCHQTKKFRVDSKSCGCAGTHPHHMIAKIEKGEAKVLPGTVVVEKIVKEPASEREKYLRATVSELKSQMLTMAKEEGFFKETMDEVINAIHALEPLPPQPFQTGTKADAKIGAVIKLSDWHIGAQTPLEATEGFGSFDWAKAQAGVPYIAQKFLGWIETHRMAFNIPNLTILSEGDMISGDIHYELQVTNEFPAPVQAVKAGSLLAQFVSTVAPHFEKVTLSEINIDNHSRLTKKLQFAQGDENSWGYVVHAMANALLKDHKNIEIIQAKGIRQVIDVEGVKFLTEHGHTTKAWMGIPYYGIERQRGKEASKRIMMLLEQGRREFDKLKRDIGFDFMSIGHWHVPGVVSGNIIINGCLPGTTEYDHASGRFAPPSQVSFLVHPKYKIFDWTAWQPKY